MGLFDKKTDAEKQAKAAEKERKKEARQDEREDRKEQRAEEKEVRQDAREDRKDARKDARAEKKDARQDAHEEKKDARQDKRDMKKDARQDKRAEMKEIRQSDLKGKEKREAKADVRDDKRDAIDAAKEEKHDAIDAAKEQKKDRKGAAKDEKKDALKHIDEKEAAEMAKIEVKHATLFDGALALELLALTHAAHWQDAAELAANEFLKDELNGGTCTLRGGNVLKPVPIFRQNFKSDTECFVARTELNDLVVAFRGSEFFNQEGGFRDWVLTDFRANRIPYPPAPSAWPDQRWVHAGFWDAYNLVRNSLLAEVGRQTNDDVPTNRVFVTGFSLGGALALLAALDIADGMKGTPVELFTFAAPRAGDPSLNNLLEKRVKKSTLIAFRGDPVVHLPPLGPNFPVTFKNIVSLDPAGIHIPIGNALPQVNQEYRTADKLFYINKDGEVNENFPTAQIALNYKDHDWGPYNTAITNIRNAQGGGKVAFGGKVASTGR
jgi:hypothetical protein